MPLISISQTSPCFMLAVAPSVPIQRHVARIQRQVLRHRHQEVYHAEHHVVGLERDLLLVVQPHLGQTRSSSFTLVSIQGPIGLNVSVFFARHRVRSLFLPGALAHVVADRVAQYPPTAQCPVSDVCTCGLSRRQLSFILHLLGGILRDHDRLAVRDQRVVGAVAGIRMGRQRHLQTKLLGGLA